MSEKFPTIRYQSGTPDCACICLCAVPFTDDNGVAHETLVDDIVLYYDGDGRWGYMRSDQWYRGTVLGFIGPIERLTQQRVAAKRAAAQEDVFDV